MRTRQKLTAVGAVALATSAIGGGAVATSHAMADSSTPVKGTMTVISMTSDSDGPIKCVYDNIDLPTLAVGTGLPGVVGGAISVTGSGPVDANGQPMPGTVMVTTGSAVLPDGQTPDQPPTFVVGGGDGPTLVQGVATATGPEAGTSSAGGDESTSNGPVLTPPPGAPIAIDSADARPGTAEECAAMQPTTALPPVTP